MIIQKNDELRIAEQLVYHIIHPCVEPTTGLNIREFYLREARGLLPSLTDPDARSYLQRTIDLFTE